MTLKTRIEKLEIQVTPDRAAVIIAADLVWDVITERPFVGDVETAVVIAHIAVPCNSL